MTTISKNQPRSLPLISSQWPAPTLWNQERAPGHPDLHLFRAEGQAHAFLPNGSRVYGLNEDLARILEEALTRSDGESVISGVLRGGGLKRAPLISKEPLKEVPVASLSLAIAQSCNLACTYCYAEEGNFGGSEKAMSLEVAQGALKNLIEGSEPGSSVHVAFMGGEPLVNRTGIRKSTAYALELAKARNIRVGFAITTNGTLVTEEDAQFFEEHGFAVTVSLDGLEDDQNQLRPLKGGGETFQKIKNALQPLLRLQNKMEVTARVTVTPKNLRLPEILEELLNWGFYSVGFSPMLSSPTHRDEMASAQLSLMHEQMVECGSIFLEHALRGERYGFSNIETALREIHKGSHRPYPCGAGAGYLGVSADGDYAACHRFVGDELVSFGNVSEGLQQAVQTEWLKQRHVDKQEPCQSCWARYLCGGGCHYEVIKRGRIACDSIRSWLDFCLKSYTTLMAQRPEYFS